MRRLFARSLPILSALLVSGAVLAAEKTTKTPTLGVLSAPTEAIAREQAAQWLRDAGKTDEASLKAFDALWAEQKPLLDKVAATLALGDADAAKLLADARDRDTPAPLEVPAVLKDTKKPIFYRANLTAAYAKALSNR